MPIRTAPILITTFDWFVSAACARVADITEETASELMQKVKILLLLDMANI